MSRLGNSTALTRNSFDIPIIGTYTDATDGSHEGTRTGVVVTTEAGAEGALTLGDQTIGGFTVVSKDKLIEALCRGRVMLALAALAKTTLDGSSYLEVDSIQYSIDGTYYTNWQSFAPVAVNALGEFGGVEITRPFPGNATKIRLQTTETGTMDFTFYAALRVEIPERP